MKLLRLRLRDFRGVAEREVSFLPRGVTVIEGPNESGKTSLADAIDLVFDKRSSSTDRAVRSLQPVGSDVGTEVEVEVEAGPYRFVLFKRFNRQHETVLRVQAPSPEDHSGREAHERAQEILAETVDLDLWRALRVEQGNTFSQPEVGGSRSLLAALEGASREGERGGKGVETESLFERIRETRELYFTAKTGRPTGELREARLALDKAEAKLESVEGEYRRLEQDVEREGVLASRLASLREDLERAGARQREATEAKEEVDRLLAEVAKHKAKLDDERVKVQLLRDLVDAEKRREEVRRDLEKARKGLQGAKAAAEPAVAAREAAKKGAAEAETALATARRRIEVSRRRSDLERRLQRYRTRSERFAVLKESLAGTAPRRQDLDRLEHLTREVDRAEAALGAVSASLRISAREPIELELGDETVTVAAGEKIERRIDRTVRLDLKALRLELAPGRDPEELRRRLEERQREIAERLEGLGVESVAKASEAFTLRRDLETERRRLEEEMAAEDPLETLQGELAALDEAPVAEGSETDMTTLEGRQEAAREELTARERTVTKTNAAVEAARRLTRDLEIEAKNSEENSLRSRTRIGNLVEALAGDSPSAGEGGTAGQLDLFQVSTGSSEGDSDPAESAAQGAGPDPAFEQALAEARRREDEARALWGSLEASLSSTRPEAVRRRAEAAVEELETLRRRLSAAEGELRELRGRLAAHRERDLFEGRQEARSRAEAARRAAGAVERRALAADRLWSAFVEARDTARETYGEPLRYRIEDLGQELFGESFEVELDDELRIARRILQGEALEVERLSAGAREQLALLGRLASAMIAAKAGLESSSGVPLIIDDALGSADPERLAAMERVIDRVGERCQIILLTCFPQRYQGIRGASVVAFSGNAVPTL